jgi:hypothetical protein
LMGSSRSHLVHRVEPSPQVNRSWLRPSRSWLRPNRSWLRPNWSWVPLQCLVVAAQASWKGSKVWKRVVIFEHQALKPSAVDPRSKWGQHGVNMGATWGQYAPPTLAAYWELPADRSVATSPAGHFVVEEPLPPTRTAHNQRRRAHATLLPLCKPPSTPPPPSPPLPPPPIAPRTATWCAPRACSLRFLERPISGRTSCCSGCGS